MILKYTYRVIYLIETKIYNSMALKCKYVHDFIAVCVMRERDIHLNRQYKTQKRKLNDETNKRKRLEI